MYYSNLKIFMSAKIREKVAENSECRSFGYDRSADAPFCGWDDDFRTIGVIFVNCIGGDFLGLVCLPWSKRLTTIHHLVNHALTYVDVHWPRSGRISASLFRFSRTNSPIHLIYRLFRLQNLHHLNLLKVFKKSKPGPLKLSSSGKEYWMMG